MGSSMNVHGNTTRNNNTMYNNPYMGPFPKDANEGDHDYEPSDEIKDFRESIINKDGYEAQI